MADDVVIRAEGLGKKYVIGHQAEREGYTALRDVLARRAKTFGRTARDLFSGRAVVGGDELEDFWALKDLDFEIRRGEVVGVIGRNGAGKSTLLKVLSRITEPTEGRVTIKGRVASLLEVGTGFHPELTGRENIFLNGAILGMSRAEIRRKFDEIVDFAEVEKFLDTPVKRYSSGMYVRLAFAVAAHLEPEILVVDEVLAVGDAEFQKKCLGKMQDVAGHGRTVLFVSHNMAAIRKLCSSGIALSNGRATFRGPTMDAISAYLQASDIPMTQEIDLSDKRRKGDGKVTLNKVVFAKEGGQQSYRIFESAQMRFDLEAADPADMAAASVWLLFRNSAGDDVLMVMQKDSPIRFGATQRASISSAVTMNLTPGRYSVACGVIGHGGREINDWIDDAFLIDVDPLFEDGSPFDARLGLISSHAEWRLERSAP